jgi:ABC-2 type transport system permease protein
MSTQTPVFTPTGPDLSFVGELRSEWIKLRSIRSTWWCFAIFVVLTVGLGALVASTISAMGGSDAQSSAVQAVTVGISFGALVIGVLGVLVIAGEYGTGMIRSTLTAVPTRVPALIAKALVFAVVTFVVSVVAFAITVPITVGLLSRTDIVVDLGDPAYWLALLGGAGYLVAVGLISFCIGAILRNTAGGVAVSLGLVLVVPIVIGIIGGLTQLTWLINVGRLLPSELGTTLYGYPSTGATAPASDFWVFEPWQAALLLLAWVVALFTTAAVLLKRRDA